MPRKKRTSITTTTEKANTKAEPKSATASRSKSRTVKPKKSPTRTRKTSKSTARSKSTAKRGRPAKSKAPVQDLSRESSVASESPEIKKKPGRKASSNVIEKSVGKVKKEEKATKTSTTKTPGRPKSKGRPAKAKAAKSTSKAPKAKEVKEIKEEVQTRSARKPRKNEKKEERTPSPDPEPPKGTMTTPKRNRKTQSRTQMTPVTEKAKTRAKASVVCKKEDTISDRSEREDDFKGRSKRKEKKPAAPSRTQAKMLQKKMKKEAVDLPRFPTQEASIEGLIVEAIKGLKTKAMEDRIIGYLGKRFSDVDGGYIKNVLHKMTFDETLLLRGLGGGSASCGKRDFDENGMDTMETSMMKKVKTSRNSSPAHKEVPRGGRRMQVEDDRSERRSARMEIENVECGEVKNEDDSNVSKKMEEEKVGDVVIKEEAEKVEIPPIIIQEEEDIVLKLSASDSKKALIEYYERKLLGIRGLLTTDKKDKKPEITPGQGITPGNPAETPMPVGEVQTKEPEQEAKKEEQDEVRTTSVRRPELNESVEQIVSEKRNLSFDKETLDKKQGAKSDEKIEEDEGRGMVIWEMQQSSELEKTIGTEALKETGQENGIELLMKLLTLPGVVTPEGADDQKVEETPQPRAEEEKKVEISCEKIEETAENKAAEDASTKTEPKVEEPVEKAEEGVQKGGNNESDLIRKKMRSAVESYLEMLQGRIDLDYSRENNAENNLSTSEEDKENKDVNNNKTDNKDVDKKIEEDYVKEESDLERPQKLSVSKFLS